MNKRQRKKNVKNALDRYQAKEATKKDIHVIKTQGRRSQRVKEVVGTNYQEAHDVITDAYETIFNNFSKAMKQFAELYGTKIRRG